MAAPTVKQRKVATSTGSVMTATLESTPTAGNLLVLRIGLRVAEKVAIAGWTNVTPNEEGTCQILAKVAGEGESKSVEYDPPNIAAMELAEIAPASGKWKTVAEAIPVSGTGALVTKAAPAISTPTLSPEAEALLLAVLGVTFSASAVTPSEPFKLQTNQGARSLYTADASGAAGEYKCTFTLTTEQTGQAGMIAVVNPSTTARSRRGMVV